MRWSYKTVHYDYKKEGLLGGAFLDEAEMEESMNEFGLAGWELVSLLEVQEGLIATFKQPIDVPVLRDEHLESRGTGRKVDAQTSPRFLRPERTQGEGGDMEDDVQMQETEENAASRPSRSTPAKVVNKRRSGGDGDSGAGSIRIE